MDARVPLVTGLLAGCATVAAAAEWSAKSLFSETISYDSNRDLATVAPDSVISAVSAMSLSVLATSPTAQFGFSGHLDYPAETGPGADSTSDMLHYGFSTKYEKRLRLDTLKFSASLVPESTQSVALTESGETTFDATRWTTVVNGSLEHQISPLDALSLSASSSRVSYTGNPGTLVPYSSMAADGTWRHRVSRVSDFTASAGWSRNVPDDIATPPSDTYSATFGYGASLTRQLSFSASAGPRVTLIETDGTSTGWVGDVALTYKAKTATYSLNASRSAVPDSFGFIQDSTSVNLSAVFKVKDGTYSLSAFHASGPGTLGSVQNSNGVLFGLTHQISDLSSASVAVSYSAFQSASEPDRQLLTVAPTYSFQATKHLQGNIAYRFTQRFGGSGDATSNAVFFGLSGGADLLHERGVANR